MGHWFLFTLGGMADSRGPRTVGLGQRDPPCQQATRHHLSYISAHPANDLSQGVLAWEHERSPAIDMN